MSAPKELIKAVQSSKSAIEFTCKVQQTLNPDLLDILVKWSYSTPELNRRFRYVGWFGIAAAFYVDFSGGQTRKQ